MSIYDQTSPYRKKLAGMSAGEHPKTEGDLFHNIRAVGAHPEVQASLGVIQKNLDNSCSQTVERVSREPFQRVTADYFKVLHGALPDDPANAVDPKRKVTTVREAKDFIVNAGIALDGGMIEQIHEDHGYKRNALPSLPQEDAGVGGKMKQGSQQVQLMATYYVEQLQAALLKGDKDSLIVLNVLGNNSREGTTLTTAVHQAMIHHILAMENMSPKEKGDLLINMLGRTVFLNTGAAGKGITTNQITGWVITPAGSDLQALGNTIFEKDSTGVFKLKTTDPAGIVLNSDFCNLKQFNTNSAVLHISMDDDGVYRAKMTSKDGKTIFFENMPIRAAGKVSGGTPSILIGGTEAEMNANMEKRYFARVGAIIAEAKDKVEIEPDALKKAIGFTNNSRDKLVLTNPPILTEWNSTNTGENVSMGSDKLVEYLMMKKAAEAGPGELRAMQTALKCCQDSMISLRILLYPKPGEEALSGRVKQRLSEDDKVVLEKFAADHKDAVASALSESHYASTQAGAQSSRAGGTVLHQLRNPLGVELPAFKSASMLLTMFDPKYLSHMPEDQAAFELIGYVKEFWQALTYLGNESKFHIADIIDPQEFDRWVDLTVKIYNAVLTPEIPFTADDVLNEKLSDINQFFSDIWAKFEPKIPTLGSEASNVATIFTQYAGPVIKARSDAKENRAAREVRSPEQVQSDLTGMMSRDTSVRQNEGKEAIEQIKRSVPSSEKKP